MDFVPADPRYRERMKASFARQGFLKHLGVSMTDLQPGKCRMEAVFAEELSQQHGYFHGGAVATLADVACGYAAYSLAETDASMVTVEFKVNFLAPAMGERIVARGQVIKAGKTLTVCRCDVACVKGEAEIPCAAALATFIALPGRPEKAT
jgi:uncharacterized protein (TIGR00369 family)